MVRSDSRQLLVQHSKPVHEVDIFLGLVCAIILCVQWTNYENGIKNGVEEYYANINDKIILYDGYVTSNNITSSEKRINSLEWTNRKEVLLWSFILSCPTSKLYFKKRC